MNKSPEETLKELERIAEQSRKDAELVRAYIELQSRLGNTNGKVSEESKSDTVIKKKPGRPAGTWSAVGEAINFIKESKTPITYLDLRAHLGPLLVGKTEEQVAKRVADIISQDIKPDKTRFKVEKVDGKNSITWIG